MRPPWRTGTITTGDWPPGETEVAGRASCIPVLFEGDTVGVLVRVWSASWVEAAEFRLDRGPWCPLESASEGLWRGSLPGDQLAKGTHRLGRASGDERGHR